MSTKKLFVYPIIISLLGILIFAAAASQTPQGMTDFAPADRPPVDRDVVETPATPAELPESTHLLEGSRRLVLQDLSVVILMADEAGSETEVADYLLASGYVATVDVINVQYETPALADIEGYDAALTWSNSIYHDPVSLGDVLADFLDLGKGVIALEFAFWGYSPVGLEGRFMTDYSPFSHGTNIAGYDVSLGAYDPEHPLMTDVSAVTEFYAVDVGLTGVGTCVAWWNNDWPFVAYNRDNNKAVGVNGYVGGLYREWTGDMLQVVLNSVLFVTGTPPNACRLSKFGGGNTWYNDAWYPGDRAVTFFDPIDCPDTPTYPFGITSLDFQLYLFAGSYPVDIDIVVFDMLEPDDQCQGPGVELCRFTYTCDESFQRPNVGTALFPHPCCVERPFFIGIEYKDPVEASITFDENYPNYCENWVVYLGGDWADWPLGNFAFWMNGETYSPDCLQEVPTLSEWGMIVMGLLLLAVGTVAVVKSRKTVYSKAA